MFLLGSVFCSVVQVLSFYIGLVISGLSLFFNFVLILASLLRYIFIYFNQGIQSITSKVFTSLKLSIFIISCAVLNYHLVLVFYIYLYRVFSLITYSTSRWTKCHIWFLYCLPNSHKSSASASLRQLDTYYLRNWNASFLNNKWVHCFVFKWNWCAKTTFYCCF